MFLLELEFKERIHSNAYKVFYFVMSRLSLKLDSSCPKDKIFIQNNKYLPELFLHF